MTLEHFIQQSFPQGLSYQEAAQLCLQLFCTVDGVPEQLQPLCSKDTLAETFAHLARQEFLTTPPLEAPLYGANFHMVEDKGHWVEVISSVFKKGNTLDRHAGNRLLAQLTASNGHEA